MAGIFCAAARLSGLWGPADPRNRAAALLLVTRMYGPALKSGLQRAGLHASYFAWPPTRNARPIAACARWKVNAGIFFGREAPVIEAIDRLRVLTEARLPTAKMGTWLRATAFRRAKTHPVFRLRRVRNVNCASETECPLYSAADDPM